MTENIMAERRPIESASTRANRRLLGLSGLLGGVMGLLLAVNEVRRSPDGHALDILTAPLPAALALALAALWGIVLPLISWRWHKVVDEHEREAYRDGSVAGFYVLSVAAPVWWLLARGGMAPPVDGFWVYGAVMIVSGAFWLWRKHR